MIIANIDIPSQEECNALASELLWETRRPSLLSKALDERIAGMIGCSLGEHSQVAELVRKKHVAIAYALWFPLIP